MAVVAWLYLGIPATSVALVNKSFSSVYVFALRDIRSAMRTCGAVDVPVSKFVGTIMVDFSQF